jgi:small subunit ribosomal protein S4
MFAARQFVSHGHVKLNGRRVTIPSIRLKAGDTIELTPKAKDLAVVLEASQLAERDVPDYVEANHSNMTARLVRVPGLSDVPYPVKMEPNFVVEYYSR